VAQKIPILLTDDIDGSEAGGGDRSVPDATLQ